MCVGKLRPCVRAQTRAHLCLRGCTRMYAGGPGVDGWTDANFPNKIKDLQRPPRVDVGWTGWTAVATGPTEQMFRRGVTNQHGVQTPLQAFDLREKGLQREVIILTR